MSPINTMTDSSSVAHIYTRLFLADILLEGYRRNDPLIREFVGAVDADGYDVIFEQTRYPGQAPVTRHIQLKQSLSPKASHPVNQQLNNAPGGCVVLSIHNAPGVLPDKLAYFFFGNRPGSPLTMPLLPLAKKKGGGSRAGITALQHSAFIRCKDVAHLYDLLFI